MVGLVVVVVVSVVVVNVYAQSIFMYNQTKVLFGSVVVGVGVGQLLTLLRSISLKVE